VGSRRRYRRERPGLDQWVSLPWQVSAAAGAAAFVFLAFVLPATMGGALGRALAPGLSILGVFALLGFGFTSLASFWKTRQGATRVEAAFTRGATKHSPSTNVPPATKLDSLWDESMCRPMAESEMRVDAKPKKWSVRVLRGMEWKRFEFLAAAYYETIGFRTEPIGWGADGGVDVVLYRGELTEPVSVVQCKAWSGRQVPVEAVRALLGVMTDRKVRTGVFLTTSTFTSTAAEFADGNRIALVDGADFLKCLLALPINKQAELLSVASEGDWTVPSCPSCGVKMAQREGKRGRFWGCPSFPRCRNTFEVRKRTEDG
jgi:restriction system protein